MNLDDAKELWSSDEPTDESTMSTRSLSESDILHRVKERSRAFDRKIWWRDLLESGAALVVFVAFAWIAWDAPGLVRAGALIVMGGSAYIFWRLRRARTRHDTASPARPVAERLRVERAKVDAQIHLLETVAQWYLAPLATGALLIVVGSDGVSWSAAGQIAIVLAAAAGIYALNQQAVQQELQPRREELTRLLDQVDTGGASSATDRDDPGRDDSGTAGNRTGRR